MISVYSTLFNVEKDLFDIKDALKNWSKYADEIVIATVKGQSRRVCEALSNHGVKTIVVGTEITLDDPLFDGKLKNEALQNCSNEIVIQQDFDERLGGNIDLWNGLGAFLKRDPAKAFMLPVVDLYKDVDHYKSVGFKWYLHKKTGCYRGVVNFAQRTDGTINTEKSDTCELINEFGDLVSSYMDNRFLTNLDPSWDINMPHIIHLGYLDIDKRVENNKFWGPVWTARNGQDVDVETDKDKLLEFECWETPKKLYW